MLAHKSSREMESTLLVIEKLLSEEATREKLLTCCLIRWGQQDDAEIVSFEGLEDPAQPLVLRDIDPLGVHQDRPDPVGAGSNLAVPVERQDLICELLLAKQPPDLSRHLRFIGQIDHIDEVLRCSRSWVLTLFAP